MTFNDLTIKNSFLENDSSGIKYAHLYITTMGIGT